VLLFKDNFYSGGRLQRTKQERSNSKKIAGSLRQANAGRELITKIKAAIVKTNQGNSCQPVPFNAWLFGKYNFKKSAC
jgi:hypothetical protein